MYTKYSIEEIKEKLKNCLNEERFLHSIGTMEMAMELAQKYGCDVEKAQVAGLLHDCAKCIPKNDLEKMQNSFEECEKLSEKTWHAPVGVIVAKEEYGIGFRKEDVKLRDEVQKILKEMQADGTVTAIALKWFGTDLSVIGK